MDISAANQFFRKLFSDFINDGYKKRHICSLTLGVQSEPQLENFISHDKDFGIKPLQRIAETAGYDIQFVFVKKGNIEYKNGINQINNEFKEEFKSVMVKSLDNSDLIKSSTVLKTGVIADISNEIFNEVIKD